MKRNKFFKSDISKLELVLSAQVLAEDLSGVLEDIEDSLSTKARRLESRTKTIKESTLEEAMRNFYEACYDRYHTQKDFCVDFNAEFIKAAVSIALE